MILGFLCLAIFVHVLLLYAVFDIYFSSPIVQGAKSFPIASEGSHTPADRLVFFSAGFNGKMYSKITPFFDGLRASTFFAHKDRSPYLHSLIRDSKATWGISQSHVPTESRPGHVALMAGFYEDVSAVTSGWKHNPVPFDSTLNQSAHAFLWGSPDIVELFSQNIGHSRAEVYSTELEDFASESAAQLDEWVFRRVEVIFARSNSELAVARQLATRRSIFFLHLLGLDTNGHGHKPHSEHYLENIRVVDQGIRRMVQLFDTHFGDNRTAYLFTADHGMTDWGSHGDGTEDEVQTPFVAWGAGIEGSRGQVELSQVDIAPLQSALLGCAIPVNSFGVAPLRVLAATPKYKFQVAHANLRQMVEQYTIRREERRAHSFRALFSEAPSLQFEALPKIEAEIERLVRLKRYEAAWKACVKWIAPVRDALNYYHRYHRFAQGTAIAAVFCAWNLVLYASLTGKSRHSTSHGAYVLLPRRSTPLFFLAALLVRMQRLSPANYFYFLTPIYLCLVASNLLGWSAGRFATILGNGVASLLNARQTIESAKSAASAMAFGGTALALLIGVFFERALLSLIFCAISLFYMFNAPKSLQRWRLCWLLLCLLLALFPLLPTVGSSQNVLLVIFAELCCSLALLAYSRANRSCHHSLVLTAKVHSAVAVLHAIGPNAFTSTCAWGTLPLAFALPLVRTPHSLAERLLLWSSCLQLPFAALSVGHEAAFLPLFCALLLAYVRLECAQFSDAQFLLLRETTTCWTPYSDRKVTRDDWTKALLFIAAVEMAFFGTGNIASLNSFNPSSLRLFLSVFSPFAMAALLLLKVALPFLALALHFAAASAKRQQIARLATSVGIITNCMALVFFCCLQTDGSWLQIGISISNYVICLVCSGFVYALLLLADQLLYAPKLLISTFTLRK